MTRYAFFKGKIVPIEDAKISVMTHAFNYGTGVFGGLRAYWNANAEQLFIFRPLDHFERLHQSGKIMQIEIPYTPQELTDALTELLRREEFRENVYIRPIAYKSDEKIGVRLHDIGNDLTMFAVPMGDYIKTDGAHAHVSGWRRIDDNAIPARGKIIGAYANSALIKSDAVLSGYDEAIVLNEDGHVSEASAANIFMVRDRALITPPVTANSLEGIVRRSLIKLAQNELGMDVIERNIDRSELYLADEVLLCGTGVQIAGVTRVDHRVVGDGTLGAITRQLQHLFMDVVMGYAASYTAWIAPVYERAFAAK